MDYSDIEKRIGVVAFALAGMGLISELIAIFSQTKLPDIVMMVLYLARPLNLHIWNLNMLQQFNPDSYLMINFPNLVFCFTMLLSACFYVFSKYKETRLLQFSFAVIILFNALQVICSVTILFSGHITSIYILSMLTKSAMAVLAYWSLVHINKSKVLETEIELERGYKPEVVFIDASKGERLTHLLFDTIFCIFTVSPLIGLIYGLLEGLYTTFESEQLVMSVAFLIFRTVYYTFFESVFGATPGKFLTGTRVVMNHKGQRPSFKIALVRTLSRFIPFEPFSFLGRGKWHDTITETQVVREKNTGVRGSRYWLIPVSYIVIVLAGYGGREAYVQYQYKAEGERSYQQKKQALEHSLKNLSTDALLKAYQTTYESNSSDIYLKAEEVKDSSIVFSVLVVADSHEYTLYQLEQLYLNKKDRLIKLELGKDSLFSACMVERYDHRNHPREIDLFGDKNKFQIEQIDRLFAPNISDKGTGSTGESIRIDICNDGWPATIVEVVNIENQIQWDNLPLEVPSVKKSYAAAQLTGKGLITDKPYKCHIIVVDSLNRRYTYLLEGLKWERIITRID